MTYGPGNVIDSFTGAHGFLSNFYGVGVAYDGLIYPSVEHAYQAAKSFDATYRGRLLSGTAARAKRLGRQAALRPDWEEVKVGIMRTLLREKFRVDSLKSQLAATAPHELVEGNWWGDRFWGVCDGQGLNMLGKLLMEIRDE